MEQWKTHIKQITAFLNDIQFQSRINNKGRINYVLYNAKTQGDEAFWTNAVFYSINSM